MLIVFVLKAFYGSHFRTAEIIYLISQFTIIKFKGVMGVVVIGYGDHYQEPVNQESEEGLQLVIFHCR